MEQWLFLSPRKSMGAPQKLKIVSDVRLTRYAGETLECVFFVLHLLNVGSK